MRPPRVEEPQLGSILSGRYRLDSAVGRGGSAVVYRALDEELGETVAIKVLLLDGILASEQARAADLGFREEAIAAMRLAHPKILRVYNYERHAPWEFLVMELVAGEDLRRYRKRHPGHRIPVLEAIEIGIECLDALSYAHGVGVVHNDIKPSNILLTRAGAIKICDFGLAEMGAAAARKRILAGTPAFMSPERIKCETTDARSDLYSLAASLYTLVTGHPMFGGNDEALMQHLFTPPPTSPHLPDALYDVLRVASAKHPDDRFQTAA